MQNSYHQPEDERTFDSRPPDPIDALAGVYRIWRRSNESKHLPNDYNGAAQWWIDHQEQRGRQEKLMQETDHKGNKVWKDPYIVRLVVNLRIFLTIFTEVEKSYIVNKIGSGIPWRGDELEFYKMVVEQEEVMKTDKHAYIEKALQAMKSFRFAQ